MSESRLQSLRTRIDHLNERILELLQERAGVVLEIARLKHEQGIEGHDPLREDEMIHGLLDAAPGPFARTQIREIFRAIFRASLELLDEERHATMRSRRRDLLPEGGVRVGDVLIGSGSRVLLAGPCAVESREQVEAVAAHLASFGVPALLRGGAYKPRTSPYSFQGLREEGLRILRDAADRHGLAVVTEVLDVATLPAVVEHADMLQVGARNMYNTELLKALGRIDKPVLLKRGFMATLEELLLSAEYILASGNDRVVLCERGIRTFERSTRNTLDVSAVPLLQQETRLPVVVDLSHALGRRDLILPCGRAALAAGAHGLMVEVHPDPDRALSDAPQQLDLAAFTAFVDGLGLR